MNEIFHFFENPLYELKNGVHLPTKTHFFNAESIINLGKKF